MIYLKSKILKQLRELETNWDEKESESLFNYIFGYNEFGMQNIVDGEIIYNAIILSKKHVNRKNNEIINERIFKNAENRYSEIIEPYMIKIPSSKYYMGSNENNKLAYCGE